jgi:threonine/homoserine/homoserine lactone efflux protein
MPIAAELYLTHVAASIVVVIVPGPSVTVIIANSLAHGPRAGLLNVAGTQAGLAVMLAVLLAGLAPIVETMGLWFDRVRIAGALYLVWLGWKMARAGGEFASVGPAARGARGYFWQGLVVVLANPKALLPPGRRTLPCNSHP